MNATAARYTPAPDQPADTTGHPAQYGQYGQSRSDHPIESTGHPEWQRDPAAYAAPASREQQPAHEPYVDYDDSVASQWHHSPTYPTEEQPGQDYEDQHGYQTGPAQGYADSAYAEAEQGSWYAGEAYDQEPSQYGAPGSQEEEFAGDHGTDDTRRSGGHQLAGHRAGQEETGDTREDQSSGAAPLWFSFSRGVALFLGMLALLNVLGEMRSSGFDGSLWWIDLGRLPNSVSRGLLAAFAGLSLSFGLAGRLPGPVRKVALSITGVLLVFSMWSMLDYYQTLRNGLISSSFPVPFALHVSACFAVLLRGLLVPGTFHGSSFRHHMLTMATAGLCMVAFPLCQICCYGNADHRQPADAVVVFGCGVDQQGKPSSALQDRMRTGCELYHAGLARTVVLSGGPGPGMVHETEAMRKLAEQAGVPANAIRIDRDGFDTLSTVRNLSRFQTGAGDEPFTALMVSHFYHLPRIGLCCRHSGISASTVPARQQYVLRWQAWYIAREIPALWRCWLRPLMGGHGEPSSSLASAETL
ncbi:MAG: YdcF family protein [Planctomycetaceae bacterium]|nr:YdcF family protein [Planctomycetaceae bacterium]